VHSPDRAVARIGYYLFANDDDMLAAYLWRMTAEGVELDSGSCYDGEGEHAYTPGEGLVLDRNGCFLNDEGYANYRAHHVRRARVYRYPRTFGRHARARELRVAGQPGHAGQPDAVVPTQLTKRPQHGRHRRIVDAARPSVQTEPMAEELADRPRTLADLVPILEAPDAEFGHWEVPPPVNGIHSFGYFVFGPTAEAWRAGVGRGGWVIAGFDWRSWLDTHEGRSLSDRPEAVASATPEQLGKLLTAIVRSDRFVEGSIEGAFESGLLACIARRAAALLEPGSRFIGRTG